MKRIQPFYLLIVLAAFFVLAGLAIFGLRYAPLIKSGSPVEPLPLDVKNPLFDYWYDGAEIYDLSVDRYVTGILFSSSANKVSLLDRDRRLRWDKSFNSKPLQAKISSCGNYMAVGTSNGNLYFISVDNQNVFWENELLEPVYQLSLSTNGMWVAVGRGQPDQAGHSLELYNRDGTLQWQVDTGMITGIYQTGEQVNQGSLFYSSIEDGNPHTSAVTLNGEPLWSVAGYTLAGVSRNGYRLALVSGNEVMLCNNLGKAKWESELPFNVETVMFNPQNSHLLVYGSGNGAIENLYYFNLEGELLWKKRIADGSLCSFTADGRQIIASSWRHYKDDFSQMVLFKEDGSEIKSWEVAMRVEHLAVSGNRRYIVLAGDYLAVVDLEEELERESEWLTPAVPLYSPMITETREDQTAVTMFFYDGSQNLIPVTRQVSQTENRIRAALEELIRGPSRDSYLYRTIHKDAQFEARFSEEGGLLVLDLAPEIVQVAGSAQSFAALDSLLLTLGNFSEVKAILLTVKNEEIEIFGDGLLLEQPLSSHRWKHPVFIPVRLGERYYLVPREARELELEQRNLEDLLRAALKEARSLYFVPADLHLLNVDETPGEVKINLSRSLTILFPDQGGVEEQLQAALLLDSLYVTAVENSGAKRVEILVEGESWSPPEGYPSLYRTFYNPYYLNPE